jgi:hypothetical protein
VAGFARRIRAKIENTGCGQQSGLKNKNIGEQHIQQVLQGYLDVIHFGKNG